MTTEGRTGIGELNERDIERLLDRAATLRSEIGRVVVGQHEVVEELLISLFAGGHCLLEGVPGLAKTLMIRTVGQALELSFKRIQFTPDLMPSDIVGTELLEEEQGTGRRSLRFARGPIFANLVLADEINRSPPKTQAALLEAMQEREVTYGGETYLLDRPFFVLATQNPIEQTGTYPLPEAQLDRFLLRVKVDYPTLEEEIQILGRTTGDREVEVERVMSAEEVVEMQGLVRQVHVSTALVEWVSRLVRSTRPGAEDGAIPVVERCVGWGAGPRAGQSLLLTAKAKALLEGRFAVQPGDLEALVAPVLRHRVLINFQGQAEGVDADAVTRELLTALPPPKP